MRVTQLEGSRAVINLFHFWHLDASFSELIMHLYNSFTDIIKIMKLNYIK